MDVSSCAKYIDRIDKDVRKLRDLVDNTSKLEAPRRKRRQKDNASYWISIRDHAHRVNQSLVDIWSQCACPHLHCASIQMDRQNHEWNSPNPDLHFRFIITLDYASGSAPSPTLPWVWRDIEVKSERFVK